MYGPLVKCGEEGLNNYFNFINAPLFAVNNGVESCEIDNKPVKLYGISLPASEKPLLKRQRTDLFECSSCSCVFSPPMATYNQ